MGEGAFQWPSGETYKGSFRNDTFHGKGTMNWTDGSAYIGSWKMGEYEIGSYQTKKGKRAKVGGTSSGVPVNVSRR